MDYALWFLLAVIKLSKVKGRHDLPEGGRIEDDILTFNLMRNMSKVTFKRFASDPTQLKCQHVRAWDFSLSFTMWTSTNIGHNLKCKTKSTHWFQHNFCLLICIFLLNNPHFFQGMQQLQQLILEAWPFLPLCTLVREVMKSVLLFLPSYTSFLLHCKRICFWHPLS